MSPRRVPRPPPPRVEAAVARIAQTAGTALRAERERKRWTLRLVADKAGLSASAVQSMEAGQSAYLESYVRLADALGLRMELLVTDARQRTVSVVRQLDPVHSAMGEFEAGHLRQTRVAVGLDEPYQHYQFAGRADVIAWDLASRALLHIENRTRFPDLQEMAGSYNAKRAYLGRVLADRLGIDRWQTETHVVAALWSAEALHALRLRTESFRALCPDPVTAFEAWWRGEPPSSGKASMLVVLDPASSSRQRPFVALDVALGARARYRGYADAVARLAGS